MNQSSEAASTPEWLSVSQAAAALGISERAVQKRCAAGKLASRRIETTHGARWEIDANQFTRTGEPVGREPVGREPANRTPELGRVLSDIHSQSGANLDANHANLGREPNANRRTDSPEPDANHVTHLEAEVLFLRGLIEQRDRDAAELRAALREALRAMPKALAAPDMSTHAESAPGAPQARENSETGKAARPAANAREGGRTSEARPLWKVILGVR